MPGNHYFKYAPLVRLEDVRHSTISLYVAILVLQASSSSFNSTRPWTARTAGAARARRTWRASQGMAESLASQSAWFRFSDVVQCTTSTLILFRELCHIFCIKLFLDVLRLVFFGSEGWLGKY